MLAIWSKSANWQGSVRRIGIRASVIQTLAGADIIVPNSQLVTETVTNWTLSDRLRRVDLPVAVNDGADPKKVIELLEQVARAHSDVLSEPAPLALLMGYDDSSINFRVAHLDIGVSELGAGAERSRRRGLRRGQSGGYEFSLSTKRGATVGRCQHGLRGACRRCGKESLATMAEPALSIGWFLGKYQRNHAPSQKYLWATPWRGS